MKMTSSFYKNISVATLVISLFAMSCSKQIALVPTDSIDPSKAFKSVADINAGLLGAYNKLNYYSSIFYTSRITDEVMLPSENSTGSGVATYRWQYDGSFIHDAWPDNYSAIDRANRVLAVIDKIEAKPGEAGIERPV